MGRMGLDAVPSTATAGSRSTATSVCRSLSSGAPLHRWWPKRRRGARRRSVLGRLLLCCASASRSLCAISSTLNPTGSHALRLLSTPRFSSTACRRRCWRCGSTRRVQVSSGLNGAFRATSRSNRSRLRSAPTITSGARPAPASRSASRRCADPGSASCAPPAGSCWRAQRSRPRPSGRRRCSGRRRGARRFLTRVVSDPTLGSVTPKQARSEPATRGGSMRRFCSSVPNTTTGCGPNRFRCTDTGRRAAPPKCAHHHRGRRNPEAGAAVFLGHRHAEPAAARDGLAELAGPATVAVALEPVVGAEIGADGLDGVAGSPAGRRRNRSSPTAVPAAGSRAPRPACRAASAPCPCRAGRCAATPCLRRRAPARRRG